MNVVQPTLAGFLDFVRNIMGINTTVLPDDAPSIPLAYEVSLQIVNTALAKISPLVYTQAVYNLAGDNLINYTVDQSGQTYFADLRTQWNIFGFTAGVVQSSYDEGTGNTLVVQEAAKNFTLMDLQNLKTPWGRQYLAYAQTYGTLWGLT